MAKTKRITAKKIMSVIGEVTAPRKSSIVFGNEESCIEVPVKRDLAIGERMSLINDVVNMVFSESEDGEVRYNAGLLRFARAFAIVSYFTDIVLPDSADAAWEFIRESDIEEKIIDAVGDFACFGDLYHAIDEAIEFRKAEYLKKSKIDEVLDGIIDIVKSARSVIDNIDLPQIMEYLQNSNPELKGQLEEFIRGQMADEEFAE